MATHENPGRNDESLIDQAKRMQFLTDQGLSIPQIAVQEHTHQQSVRNRLQLLRLSPEDQQRVHTGKLGMVSALMALKNRADDRLSQIQSPFA